MTRIPGVPGVARRYADASDILQCVARISRKRGFDPGGVLGVGCGACLIGIADQADRKAFGTPGSGKFR